MGQMAQKTVVSLVDDLDQSEADETVEFGLDGVTYEIDLSDKNATMLREALENYVAHARRQGGRRRSPNAGRPAARRTGTNGTSSTTDREQNQAIREWARGQGMTMSDHGRIPSEVTEAYQKAQ